MGLLIVIGAYLLILLLPIILYCGLGYLLAPFYKKVDKNINDAAIEFLEKSSSLFDNCSRVEEMGKILEVDIEEILENTIKKKSV